MSPPSKKCRSTKQDSAEVKKKKKDRRCWTEKEKADVLEHLLGTIRKGHQIEKPNAIAYYNDAITKLEFADCEGSQLQNMVYTMKKKYVTAIDWRNKTGQGVLVEEGEQSVLDKVKKMCPHFDLLDEIFGTKFSITPPYLHDSLNTTTIGELSQPTIDFTDQENENQTHDLEKESAEEELMTSPQKPPKASATKKRKYSESGVEILANSAKLRFEVQREELSFKRDQLLEAKVERSENFQLQREKFEFEKTLAERKLVIEEKRIENELELQKYKIDAEMRLELDLAKLKHV